jgi:hypothetical protein
MKQTVTIRSSKDLQQFRHQFVELINIVRNADGKYVLHVDAKRSNSARPSIVSKAEFDRSVGNRQKPQTSRSAREQMRKEYETEPLRKILNRQEYLSYYYPDVPIA